MSMFEIRSGEVSNGGRDYFYIDKASNLYLNYDFAKLVLKLNSVKMGKVLSMPKLQQ